MPRREIRGERSRVEGWGGKKAGLSMKMDSLQLEGNT